MAIVTISLFNAFIADLAHAKHNLSSDGLAVALTLIEPNIIADVVVGDLTEIDYTYCSSRVVTIASSEQLDGVYRWRLTRLVLVAGGGDVGPFQYVVLYNSDNNALIGAQNVGNITTLIDGDDYIITFGDPTLLIRAVVQ